LLSLSSLFLLLTLALSDSSSLDSCFFGCAFLTGASLLTDFFGSSFFELSESDSPSDVDLDCLDSDSDSLVRLEDPDSEES